MRGWIALLMCLGCLTPVLGDYAFWIPFGQANSTWQLSIDGVPTTVGAVHQLDKNIPKNITLDLYCYGAECGNFSESGIRVVNLSVENTQMLTRFLLPTNESCLNDMLPEGSPIGSSHCTLTIQIEAHDRGFNFSLDPQINYQPYSYGFFMYNATDNQPYTTLNFVGELNFTVPNETTRIYRLARDVDATQAAIIAARRARFYGTVRAEADNTKEMDAISLNNSIHAAVTNLVPNLEPFMVRNLPPDQIAQNRFSAKTYTTVSITENTSLNAMVPATWVNFSKMDAPGPILRSIFNALTIYYTVNASQVVPTYKAVREDLNDYADVYATNKCVFNGQSYIGGSRIALSADEQVTASANDSSDATYFQPALALQCYVASPGKWGPASFGSCDDANHVICAEDGGNYGSANYRDSVENTTAFCTKPSPTDDWGFRFFTNTSSFAQLPSAIGAEYCGDHVDNNCNAFEFFARNASGSVNYSLYNESGTVYEVDPDPDAFDPVCAASLNVTVLDCSTPTKIPLTSAKVDLYFSTNQTKDTYYANRSVDAHGASFFGDIPATYYNVVARASGYDPQQQRISLDYNSDNNVTMCLYKGWCNSDCTWGTTNLCEADCDGINSCHFFNETTKQLADGTIKDGLINVAPGMAFLACGGTPTPRLLLTGDSHIDCPEGTTLIIYERIVTLYGEPVKMQVAVCRK